MVEIALGQPTNHGSVGCGEVIYSVASQSKFLLLIGTAQLKCYRAPLQTPLIYLKGK